MVEPFVSGVGGVVIFGGGRDVFFSGLVVRRRRLFIDIALRHISILHLFLIRTHRLRLNSRPLRLPLPIPPHSNLPLNHNQPQHNIQPNQPKRHRPHRIIPRPLENHPSQQRRQKHPNRHSQPNIPHRPPDIIAANRINQQRKSHNPHYRRRHTLQHPPRRNNPDRPPQAQHDRTPSQRQQAEQQRRPPRVGAVG